MRQNKNQLFTDFLSSRLLICFLLVVNAFAFSKSVSYPQCCDAYLYLQEASNLNRTGFIPSIGEESWLSIYHNYLYPLFLFFLDFVNIDSRILIGLVQFSLIIFANFFTSYRLNTVIGFPIRAIFSLLLIGNTLAVYSYSGFFLTEAIASALITFWFGLLIELLIRLFRGGPSILLFVGITFVSGAAWMTRPALIWVPIATLGISIFASLVVNRLSLIWLKLTFNQIFLWILVTVIVAMPQWLVSMNNRGLSSGVFKLGEWRWHETFVKSSYRYLTNLSGCGPVAFVFSPYTQTFEEMWPPKFHGGPIFSFNDFVATFVSGWDAVPSPLAYVNQLSIFPWVLLTMTSGFLISIPFIACYQSFRNPVHSSFRWINLCLLLVFLVSQLSVALTHGEFRFNFSGWILAVILLILACSQNFWSFNVTLYISISLAISFFIYLIGQMTLSMSHSWIACVPS
jgi:hypothetical protein